MGEGSRHGLAGSSAQGSRGYSRVLGCCSLPVLRVLLQALAVVAEFSSFGCRTDVLVFLLADCQLRAASRSS